MADLYSRLRELKKRTQNGSTAKRPGDPATSGVTPSAGPAGSAGATRAPGADWKNISPGVYERSRVFATDSRTIPFDLDQEGRWYGVSRLAGPFAGARPVFLDVETSGLSGGAGSTAFLIGLGFLSPLPEPQGPAITVYQLFLSEPSAEPALLARYGELVGDPETACYVTYNGASFDLPVLRTRHIMNRRRLPEALHWDLMPLTRRLYAPVIGSCTLGRVESLVLGLGREDDVPGSEVPARYHRFIETGDLGEIAPVLAHHYYDVAHLALLAATLQDVLDDGEAGAFSPDVSGARAESPMEGVRARYDRVALAKFLLYRGGPSELSRCAGLLDEVVEESEQRRRHVSAAARAGGFAARVTASPPRAWSVSRELRAVVARRLQQWDELREIRRVLWEVRGSRQDAVELAKVLEHRFKDHSGALAVIDRWQDLSGSEDLEITHRAGRLRRKISRWAEPGESSADSDHSTERR